VETNNVGNCLLAEPPILMVSVDLGFAAGGQQSAVADEVFALGGVRDVSNERIWIAEYINAGCIVPKI
jgi:hypothetical protein